MKEGTRLAVVVELASLVVVGIDSVDVEVDIEPAEVVVASGVEEVEVSSAKGPLHAKVSNPRTARAESPLIAGTIDSAACPFLEVLRVLRLYIPAELPRRLGSELEDARWLISGQNQTMLAGLIRVPGMVMSWAKLNTSRCQPMRGSVVCTTLSSRPGCVTNQRRCTGSLATTTYCTLRRARSFPARCRGFFR